MSEADPRTLIEQVADGLRQAIKTGELPPGGQVPSERALAEAHDVSRDTVRSAINLLTAEGLVTARSGRQGRRVREYRPLYWNLSSFERGASRDDPVTGIDEWKADLKEQGVQNPWLDVSVHIQPVPSEIATLLDIEPGVMALCRRRIRYADDVPVAIADTWVREDVGRTELDGQAPLLAPTDVVLPGGIFRAIGYPQADLEDEITIRMATPEEAKLLILPPTGSPVGQVNRVGFLEDGSPIRVMVTVFPGHRLKLRYRLEV